MEENNHELDAEYGKDHHESKALLNTSTKTRTVPGGSDDEKSKTKSALPFYLCVSALMSLLSIISIFTTIPFMKLHPDILIGQTTTTTTKALDNNNPEILIGQTTTTTTALDDNNPATFSLKELSFLKQVMVMHSCNETKRCEPIDASEKSIFVHISKSAGSSLIRLLNEHLPKFTPKDETGAEYSISYAQKKDPDAKYMLTALKSPRRHTWSLFTECKYDTWGQGVISGTQFPNNNGTHSTKPNSETDLVDFSVWLDHFLWSGHPSMKRLDMYGCYHASNYQSRVFVSNQIDPHGVQNLDELLPDWNMTQATYWNELSWVSMVEFYHESQCLLSYRLALGKESSAAAKNVSVAWAEEYLDKYCRCPPIPRDTIIVTHHAEGHRSRFHDMDQHILARMGNLTEIDMRLYEMALYQFLNEMTWLESRLGRRVLCDTVLAGQELELAYALRKAPSNNITTLYHLMKEFANDRSL
jgi:hypothetical protein